MKKFIASLFIVIFLMTIAASFIFLAIEMFSSPKKALEVMIEVETPKSGDLVKSPLTMKGRAKGNWFFEGDAPVELQDLEGNVLAESYIQAKVGWMTEEFVYFEGVLEFSLDDEKEGMLIFKRDNPSGLSENAEEFKLHVKF